MRGRLSVRVVWSGSVISSVTRSMVLASINWVVKMTALLRAVRFGVTVKFVIVGGSYSSRRRACTCQLLLIVECPSVTSRVMVKFFVSGCGVGRNDLGAKV